jgi:Na+-driven multidrug efflux pump
MVGAPVFAFSMLLQSFVRNDKNPKLAMVAVIAGGVLNTFLDWLFIYPMQLGMTGAIVASVIGTGVTCLILCLHFFRKDCNLRFSFQKLRPRYSKEIVQYGASSFLTELSGGVLIFVLNQQALLYAGELGVTVYSVLTNSAYIVNAFSNGIAQAAQPIIATNFGAKAQDRIDALKGIGLRTALIAGSTFAALGLLFPQAVVYIFVHPTEAILELAPMAVRIYFIGFIGAALNIFFTSYFQATLQPSKALTVCMLRGLILSALFAYTLPLVLDIIGIWASILLAEFITLGIAVAMDRKKK